MIFRQDTIKNTYISVDTKCNLNLNTKMKKKIKLYYHRKIKIKIIRKDKLMLGKFSIVSFQQNNDGNKECCRLMCLGQLVHSLFLICLLTNSTLR